MITRLEGEFVPTFILTGDSKYTEIDVRKENLLDEEGAFLYYIVTCNGTFICRGKRGACFSVSKPNGFKNQQEESTVPVFGERAQNIKRMMKLADVPFEVVLRITNKALGDGGIVHADGTPAVGMISWNGAKMPLETFRKVGRFFRDIYNEYKTECATIWFYNSEKKDWKALIPLQLGLSGASVTYVLSADAPDGRVKRAIDEASKKPNWEQALNEVNSERLQLLADGYQQYGTIHSHCNMGAFHSGTDDGDEFGFDWIHITIGKITMGVEFCQRIIGNTCSLKLQDITDVVELGENPIESLRDFDGVEAQLPIYQNRCFIEKNTYTYTHTNFGFGAQRGGGGYTPHWLERQKPYHLLRKNANSGLSLEEKISDIPELNSPVLVGGGNQLVRGTFRGLTSNGRAMIKFPHLEQIIIVDLGKVTIA